MDKPRSKVMINGQFCEKKLGVGGIVLSENVFSCVLGFKSKYVTYQQQSVRFRVISNLENSTIRTTCISSFEL